jgi:maltose-binding protein MalE
VIFSNRAATFLQRGLIAPLLCLILTLAGCSSPQPEPPAPTATNDAPTATLAPTIAATPTAQASATEEPEEPASAKPLLLWTSESGDALELVRKLSADWSARSGVEIEVVAKSSDSFRSDLLALELVEGTWPDLFWGSHDDLAGLLADKRLRPYASTQSAGGFLPAVVSSGSLDGQLWGVPITTQGSMFLIYNTLLTQSAPRTTDELIVQSRAAVNKSKQHYGLVAGWASARWTVALLSAYGGSVIDSSGKQPTLDTPQMREALNLLRELRVAGQPIPSTYAQGRRLFILDQVSYNIDGDWSLPVYRTYSETLPIEIAPLPIVPATGRAVNAPLGGTYLMFSSTISDEAFGQTQDLANFLTQTEQQIVIASKLERLPALAVALSAPQISQNPVLAAAAQQADRAPGIPPSIELRCSWNAIDLILPDLLTGNRDLEESISLMQRNAETCIVSQ